MVSSQVFSPLVLLTLASSFLLFLRPDLTNADSLFACQFDKIYNFGDSLSDTGNFIREAPVGTASPIGRLPYGETFFMKATGRCSDGRLIIDFIANASGLPFLNPYLEKDANFTYGVNFAVAGATALSKEVLAKHNIVDTNSNSSLGVQLGWMSDYINSTCNKEKDSLEMQRTSLFLLGEIGNNDYNFAIVEGIPAHIQEIIDLVPEVVAAIIGGVRSVIDRFGAVRVVVPGQFPFGCLPLFLTTFKTNNSNAYDEHGCLIDINNLAMYHNTKLQEAIQEFQTEYPNVIIVYSDYYNAFQWLLNNAVRLGFDGNSTLKACCGIGGDYNFNATRFCNPEDPVCPDPSRFINWDGIHYTEATYKVMAKWLIDDMVPKLHCYN